MAQQIKKKFLSPEIINYFDDQINEVASNLANEIIDRESSNGFLDGKIDQEILDRQAADDNHDLALTNLQTELNQEKTDRELADEEVLADSNSYTDQKISDLVNSAPELLDTLGEIATALQNEQSATIAILSQISAVQDSVNSLELNKEDKSNKSTNALLGTSDELYPSQNAVKTYVDLQDKKLAEATFSGVSLDGFLPNPDSIETQIRHYSNGTSLFSDKRYAAYFTDTQVIFVNAVNPYSAKITHTFVIPTGGSNFPQAMTSIGNFVYMVTGGGRLYCFDWSDKLNPLNLGFVAIGTGQHFDVTTDGVNTLFIANTTNKRVYIVDITNRSAATLITSLVLGTGATDFGTGVSFSSSYLYVSNYNNKIHVMSNISGSWVQVTTIPTIVNPCRGTVFTNSSGHKVFFVQRYNGINMAVYDLIDPALPVELKQLTAPASIQIYNLPFIFEDIIYIGLDNGQIGGVNLFNKNDIKFAGIFEPKNADGSKKFSSMRGLVRADTVSPFFRKKTFLLATGVINGSGATQKVTTVLDLPMFDFINSSAITVLPPAPDLSEIENSITDIETALNAEIQRAELAESNLQGQITSILNNTDPAAIDSFTEVVSAFQSADGDLNNAITSLASSASTNLANEVQNRQDADDNLQDQIDEIVTDVSNIDSQISGIDSRLDSLEAKSFASSSQVVAAELSYIDLDRNYSFLLSVFVGRLAAHESEDYTLSIVGGVTRLTWINSFANPDGDEKIQTGDKIFWVGYY